MSNNLENFLRKIDYNFKDSSLLEEALTHPSFVLEKNGKNYQRLEFLGDTVLSMVVAEMIFLDYKNEKEGQLSKRQAHLVSGTVISQIAVEIGLGEVMKFSKNEENNNGRSNKRNLENGLEALIGAIYIDSGIENCRKFVKKYWSKLILEDVLPNVDPVSHLQEIVQAKTKMLPKYQTSRSGGNEHEPIFTSVVEIDGKRYAANGSSKKEAQKKAAKYAIEMITSS